MASASSSSMVLGTSLVMLLLMARMRAPAATGIPISLPLTLASMAAGLMLSSVALLRYWVTSSTEFVDM